MMMMMMMMMMMIAAPHQSLIEAKGKDSVTWLHFLLCPGFDLQRKPGDEMCGHDLGCFFVQHGGSDSRLRARAKREVWPKVDTKNTGRINSIPQLDQFASENHRKSQSNSSKIPWARPFDDQLWPAGTCSAIKPRSCNRFPWC